MTRHVRTPEGVRKYGQPLGSVIVTDPLPKKSDKHAYMLTPAHELQKGDRIIGEDNEIRVVEHSMPARNDSIMLRTTDVEGADTKRSVVPKMTLIKKVMLGIASVLLALGAGMHFANSGGSQQATDTHPGVAITAPANSTHDYVHDHGTVTVTPKAPDSAKGYTALWDKIDPKEWGAADGSVSVPLKDGRVAWMYGDTFSHGPDGAGRFVHSTMIIQDGGNLHVSKGGEQVIPNDSDSHIYWMDSGKESNGGHGAPAGTNFVIKARSVVITDVNNPWGFKDGGFYRYANMKIDAKGDVHFLGWQNVKDTSPVPFQGWLLDLGDHNKHHFGYQPHAHPWAKLASGKTLQTVNQNWDDGKVHPFKDYKPIFSEVGSGSKTMEGVQEMETKDRVRTEAGVRKYGQPIGSLIVKDVFRGIKVGGSTKGKGTVDDPIDVGGDLKLAVNLIAKGQHVRLNQPDEVTIVLDKLAKRVNFAIKRGKNAPDFNLCLISVPGTNLFCEGNKQVKRKLMPQLSGVPEKGSVADSWPRVKGDEVNGAEHFRKALLELGITTKNAEVQADHLRATQSELVGPKVAGIAGAMEEGKIPEQRIFVTRDNYVLDGHHRWAAKIAKDARDGHLGDEMMQVEIIDADIGAILDFANAWTEAVGLPHVGMVNNSSVRVQDGNTAKTRDAVTKSIEEEMETKVVRYVRTPAGKKKFGQEIGTIIVPDVPGKRGAHSPLKHLTVELGPSKFPGYTQLRGANGKRYWVGQHRATRRSKPRWYVTNEEDYIAAGDEKGFATEEEALRALDEVVKPRLGWTREREGERVGNVVVRQMTEKEMAETRKRVNAAKDKPPSYIIPESKKPKLAVKRARSNDWPPAGVRIEVDKYIGNDGNTYYIYKSRGTHKFYAVNADKKKIFGRKGWYDKEALEGELSNYVEYSKTILEIAKKREEEAAANRHREAQRAIAAASLPDVGQTVKYGDTLRARGVVTKHGSAFHNGVHYPFIEVQKGNGKTVKLYPGGSPTQPDKEDIFIPIIAKARNKPLVRHAKPVANKPLVRRKG